MRKRSGRSSSSSSPEASRTLNSKTGDVADETRKEDGGFFACYLLVSLNPRHKSHTYIGFTVNPNRRIRQHNGEITCGAGRTKKKRPWEMALCIYGFPTNVAALQFEWAWQHPTESVAVRNAAASFKSLSGIANKIKLAYTMLTLPAWQGLNLTVNFFSTKYTKQSAACPSLPEHMKVRVCPMDDLPCYGGSNHNLWENEDEDEDDWDDDNEFEKIGGTAGYVQEPLVNASPYHPADRHNIMVSENFGESEENVLRKSRELITLEDQEDYLCSSGSPGKANSSTRPGSYTSEESIRDRQDIQKSELNSFELECSDGKLLQVPANDRQLLSSCTVSREVEVIDISTPSPDCRIDIFTKKRRVSDPQIIDLTKSPMFVQL